MNNISIKYLQEYIKSKDHHPELVKDYFLKLSEETGELSRAIRKNMRPTEPDQIKETIEEGREDFCCDIAAGERIFTSLLRLGYGLESVAVCGKTRRRVILRGLRATGRSIRLREIRGVIEKHAHVTLGDGLFLLFFPS